jgi:hypothetical protein
MRDMLTGLAVLAVALMVPWQSGRAQGSDPNAAFANEVIVAALPGRSIAALVTHRTCPSKSKPLAAEDAEERQERESAADERRLTPI